MIPHPLLTMDKSKEELSHHCEVCGRHLTSKCPACSGKSDQLPPNQTQISVCKKTLALSSMCTVQEICPKHYSLRVIRCCGQEKPLQVIYHPLCQCRESCCSKTVNGICSDNTCSSACQWLGLVHLGDLTSSNRLSDNQLAVCSQVPKHKVVINCDSRVVESSISQKSDGTAAACSCEISNCNTLQSTIEKRQSVRQEVNKQDAGLFSTNQTSVCSNWNDKDHQLSSFSSLVEDKSFKALGSKGVCWKALRWKCTLTTLLIALLFASGSASPLSTNLMPERTAASRESSNSVRSSSGVPENFLQSIESAVHSADSNGESSTYHTTASNPLSDDDYDSFIMSSNTGGSGISISEKTLVGNANSPSTQAAEKLSSRRDTHGRREQDSDILSWARTTYGVSSRNEESGKHVTQIDAGDSLYTRDYEEEQDEHQDIEFEVAVEDEDLNAIWMSPPTPEEKQKIMRFDPSKLNYTALRLEIDNELKLLNSREARFLGMNEYRLPRFLANLGRMLDLETVINEIETSIMTSVSCNACKGGVGLLQHYIEQGNTKEDIVRAASKLCTNFQVEAPRVCYGIIHLMVEEVVYVMQNIEMEPDGVCGFLIGDVCGIPQDPRNQWRVLFPPYQKPPLQLIKPPKEDLPTLKVLHLSDTHFDPYYQEGSNAACKEPMCCRQSSGKAKSDDARAGKWGDYRKCDTPERTIRNMFENIAQMHPDIDYILWTGDLPPHDIWNQTRDSNLHVLRETVQQLFDYFPNTPVFPALGNHESAPVNSFPPPSIPPQHSVQWLYNELDAQWRRWLPDTTSATVLKGGYYSVQVLPGFRIISLNMNYCNNKNWWLLLDSEDPADQLQWLVYELQASELKNEKVHIIGHIPPGYHDCLRVWSHNFYTIVNRFERVITAQFYGHTHFDEFELFYDPYRRYRVTNVAYIAPSQTSYYQLNPGYRLYSVQGDFDGSEKRVIDHETWVMNLDEANHPNNVNRTPRWYPLYSARRAYGMRSLLPVDWDNLVYRMVEDDSLFDTFYRHYWKNSPKRDACDSECKKRILCDLKSGRSNDRKKTCAVVHERVEAQERSQWRTWLYSGITVPYTWIKYMLGF